MDPTSLLTGGLSGGISAGGGTSSAKSGDAWQEVNATLNAPFSVGSGARADSATGLPISGTTIAILAGVALLGLVIWKKMR